MKKFKNVDEYIEATASEAQEKLKELRRCLRSILPQADEKIWYGVPFYHQQGELVGFAAYSKHISVGLGAPSLPPDRRQELETMGYRTGQGTIQIRFDQEIPKVVLRKLLLAKIQKQRSAKAAKK